VLAPLLLEVTVNAAAVAAVVGVGVSIRWTGWWTKGLERKEGAGQVAGKGGGGGRGGGGSGTTVDVGRTCRSIRSFPSSSARAPSRASVEGPPLLLRLLLLLAVVGVVVVALVGSVMEGTMDCEGDEEDEDEVTGVSPPSKKDRCKFISSVESSAASWSKIILAAKLE